jgi:hypothetical protein
VPPCLISILSNFSGTKVSDEKKSVYKATGDPYLWELSSLFMFDYNVVKVDLFEFIMVGFHCDS